MKRFIPLILKFCVLTLTVLFNVLAYYMRQLLSVTYDLTSGYLVNTVAIVIIAILFALSIKFNVNGKATTITTVIIIIASLVACYLLIPYFGVAYFTIFSSVAYTTELIINKCTNNNSSV